MHCERFEALLLLDQSTAAVMRKLWNAYTNYKKQYSVLLKSYTIVSVKSSSCDKVPDL